MAQKITLTSGSVLNGNPITFTIQPNVISGKDDDGNTVYPSFHRVITEVTCGMSGGDYEVIKMSSPVEKESDTAEVKVDISSALRTFRDSYEYSALPTTYPYVAFQLKVYDEYMLNGEVKTMGEISYPTSATYYRTLFGAFSDMERIASATSTKGLLKLSRKPTTIPQIVAVGEMLAYTPAYSTEQNIASSASLVAPESKAVKVTKEGSQTLGYQSVYALPAADAEKRQQFRFINGFGVLESISVPRVYKKTFAATTTSYAKTIQQTFNAFSRASVVKQNPTESWLYVTDPLDEQWLYWYYHEFLMSEHIWMLVADRWIPCTITPDDDATIYDTTKQDALTVAFTAKLDINGSPFI